MKRRAIVAGALGLLMTAGSAWSVDIVDGKLYLFVNSAILAKYREDPEAVIAGAKAKWPSIVNTPVNDL